MKENNTQPTFFAHTVSDMLINAPVGIFISTAEGRFDSVNPALARMLGYETPQELVNSVTDIATQVYADPADRKILIELLKIHGQVTNYECRFVNRDGHILSVILNAFAVFNSYGELTQIQGYTTDISAREYAEKMLQNKTEALSERIKELRCIYKISEIYQNESSLQDFISKTVNIIPSGLHYSESACAMIVFEGQTFKSEPFLETPWSMTREIKIHGKNSGSITVCYMEEKPEADHGPFMNEELDLLNSIADLLGKLIERSHFERDLRESERRLRVLMSNLPGMVYRCLNTPNWPLHFVSQGSLPLTGYTPEELTDNERLSYVELIHPDDREGVYLAIQEAVESQSSFQLEYRIQTKHGEEKVVWEQGRLTSDANTNEQWLEGFITDISDRKKAEMESMISQQRLATILNNINAQIYVVDMESYEVLFINQKIRTILGNVEGRKCWEVIQSGQSGPCDFCTNDKLLDSGGNPTGVYRWEFLNTRDGKWYYCHDMAIKWTDGRMARLEIAVNITERKKAEEKARHLNAVLRAIRNVNQLITQEKDREKLLTKSCLNLVETRDYYNAWIALLDGDNNLSSFYSAGLGDREGLIERHLKKKLPLDCLKKIMEGQHSLVIDDPYVSCASCPMQAMYKDRSGLCGRLEYEGKFFGILTISAPKDTAHDQEEFNLFEELLGDISFALHNLEKEDERRKAEEELRRRDVMLHIAGDLARLGGWSVDLSENRVNWSDQVAKIHEMPVGYSPTIEESINFYAPEYQDRISHAFRACVSNGISYDEEMQIITGRGRKIWIRTIGVAEKDDAGRIVRVQGGFQDITERKLADKKLTESESFQRALIDCSPLPIFSLDPDGKVLTWNKSAENVLGWKFSEVIGRPLPIVPHDKQDEFHSLRDRVMSGQSFTGKELIRQRKNGEMINISLSAAPVHDSSNRITGIMATVEDITERKKADDRLKYLSLHDQLTGLYNRAYLENEMRRLNKSREYPITIISIDVDGLKLVNDSLGHDYGDRLLRLTSDMLQKSLRKSDILARFGGDEFVALLPRTNIESGRKIVSRVREWISSYNPKIRKGQLPLNVSIGMAVAQDEASDLFAVFKEADDLMYRDKMSKEETARSQIMRALLAALEERDFVTSGHAQRLENLCLLIGKSVGLSEKKLSNLTFLTQVHDLGKVGIPDHILFKPGPLTEEEWKIMRKHPEKGYRIAQSSMDLAEIADLILKHHERWDGKGYPLGLKGKKIPIECRVLAIVDAYDAMTSDRPYRKALPSEKARQEIKKFSGTQFDPELVKVFLEILPSKN